MTLVMWPFCIDFDRLPIIPGRTNPGDYFAQYGLRNVYAMQREEAAEHELTENIRRGLWPDWPEWSRQEAGV